VYKKRCAHILSSNRHWEYRLRHPRLLALGASAVLGLAAASTVLTTSAQAAPAAVRYVALGDSYASGVGAGSTSGSCGQSPNAYPALWAKAAAPASFTFAACSGASTTDVINGQLSALTAATTLVSLTVGGNDAGFTSVMETCVLASTSSCQNAVAKGEQFVAASLPGRLDAVLAAVHAHAPGARVVVVGYPDFYDLGATFCFGLSRADHQALDAGINQLDGALQAAAARDGAAFADVRPAFAGHELCDGAGWLNSVDLLDLDSSYHPTATGQKSGYLPAFTAAAAHLGQ
jgi:lysophospholipase L1-like esterase